MADAPIIYPSASGPQAPAQAEAEQIPVINPQGVFGYLPASQWDPGAELQGYRLASQEEIRKAQLQRQYGGAGSSLVAGGLAGLRALTFGGSDWLGEKVGELAGETPEQSKAGLRELAEAHPVASGVGTVVGIALPLLLSGGADAPVAEGQAAAATGEAASAASRLAQFAPPSLVARAGKAVSGAVEGVLPGAETLAGKIATRALAAGAGSAIEGAAYGAGQVVSEAALGDPNLTAQSALATIGLSTALGGGLGGLFGAGEVAIPAALRGASDAVGGAVQKFRNAYPEVYEKLTGIPGSADMIREGMAKYGATFKTPREINALVRDLGESVESVDNAMSAARRELFSKARPLEAEELLSQVDPDTLAVRAASTRQKVADGFADAWAQAAQDPDLVRPGLSGELEKLNDGFLRRTADGSPLQVFEELRTARRQLDKLSNWSRTTKEIPPLAQENADRIARGLRGLVGDALTDETTWGPAAVRQSALDEAFSSFLDARNAITKGKLSPLGTSLLRTVRWHGEEEAQLNARALRTFLSQMGDDRSGRIAGALGDYFSSAKRFTDAMEDTFRHAPTAKFDREALTGIIDRAGALTDQAELQAEATRFFGDLNPEAQFGGSGVKALLPGGGVTTTEAGLGTIAAAPIIGHMVPGAGPLAAAYGVVKAVQGLKNVPQTVAMLASLERMTQRVSSAIDAGASMVIRGGARAATVGRAETLAGVSREFGASTEAAQQTFAKRVAEVQGYSQNPEALHRAIAS